MWGESFRVRSDVARCRLLAQVCHTYMGAGPTVLPIASLAHTGQVVRIKTRGRSYFLECDAGDTPTILIKKLAAQGGCEPKMYTECYEKVPKKMQEGYLARLQRGPIPLDDNTPIRDQQVGPEEILCYVEPKSGPGPSLKEQQWAQPDMEIRETSWYKELERQAEEERVRRVAAEEVRNPLLTG
jgi:hypothetical protein